MDSNKYVGAPCKRGHDGLRYAGKGACVQCELDRRAAQKPDDRSRALKRAWRKAHPEAVARERAAERQRIRDAAAKRKARLAILSDVKRLTAAIGRLVKALPKPAPKSAAQRKAEWRARAKARREYLKQTDPMAIRIRERIGRARRRHQARANGGVRPTQAELRAMYLLPCAYCYSRDRIEIDHKIPLTLGGQDTIGNLQPLCHDCNAAKGRTPDEAYRAMHGIL